MIEIEVRLFNSLAPLATAGTPLRLRVPEGTTACALPARLGLQRRRIFCAWRNGRDIMTTFGGSVAEGIVLSDGDRLAFSGPVPFSRGYGAPVC